MRVVVACDHAGFPLKEDVIEAILQAGHEPVDVGVFGVEPPVDYPDIAELAGDSIRKGQVERGVVICGSGVGASIAANKIKGVYAGLCHDTYSAHQGVEHDNMNVLCLGARVIGPELTKELVKVFLGAQFSNEERHRRRVGKIYALEEKGY